MPGVRNAIIDASRKNSDLAFEIPYSLAKVAGVPLIHWQLDAVEDCDTVVVLVGHQASDVKNAVMEMRPDAVFIVNPVFDSEDTFAPVKLAIESVSGAFIYVEGNILIDQTAVNAVKSTPWPVVGVSKMLRQMVYAMVKEGLRGKQVTGFTRQEMDYRWSGLAQLTPEMIRKGEGLTLLYQAIGRSMPLAGVDVDCVEINTRLDQENAEAWLSKRVNIRGLGNQEARGA